MSFLCLNVSLTFLFFFRTETAVTTWSRDASTMDAFLTWRWDPTVMLAALRCALAPWLQVHGEWLINLSRPFGSTFSYFSRLPLFIVELAGTDVSDFACCPHH